MKDIGIYIHLPFCKSKCYYCDFCSSPSLLDNEEKYVAFIKKELDLYKEELREYSVNTIFFGGGTPTLINAKYIYDILEHIYKNLNTFDVKEITIEANPKTVNEEKLNIYNKAGINRISIGVQSMNDVMLKKIGRIHTVKDFLDTYNLVRKHGFNNVSFDLMFNLPEQTLDDSMRTLEMAVELEPEHISYYSLKIEEGTPFYDKYVHKELELPDEDIERDMYHKGIELLYEHGYLHYELSNFAKKGYESKHNLIYWKCKPYIGLGISAYSYFENYRYGNTENMNQYFNCINSGSFPIVEKEFIDKNMEMAEYLILGLRLIEGISYDDFYNKFGVNIKEVYGKTIDKFIQQDLLIESGKKLRLSKKGLDLCNIVFMEILP